MMRWMMMRAAVLAAAVLLGCLAGSASANTVNCKHPAHEPHGGAIYPLGLEEAIIDNEIYIERVNAPVGCSYWLIEEVVGRESEPIWTFPTVSGLNPEIAPGETICYTLWQLDIDPQRESNRLCVTGFEGERT